MKRSPRFSTLVACLNYISILLVVCACGLGIGRKPYTFDSAICTDASCQNQLPKGVETFKNLVYPLLSGAACYNCHSEENPVRTPLFAQKDVNKAYEYFQTGMSNSQIKLANFDDVPNSALVVRGGNEHCGPGDCSKAKGDAIQAAIEEWIKQNPKDGVVKVAPNRPDAELTVPNITETGFAVMTFPLDAIGFPGASLRMEIQRAPGSIDTYKLRRPRFFNTGSPVRVKELYVYLNGVVDPGSTFGTVDAGIEANRGMTLSASEMQMIQESGPGSDKIGIAFTSVAAGAAPTCLNVAGFTTSARPVLAARCFACHAGANPTAQGLLPMGVAGQTDAAMCAKAKQLKDALNTANSVLLKAPTNSNLPLWWHPVLPAASVPKATDIENVRLWLATE